MRNPQLTQPLDEGGVIMINGVQLGFLPDQAMATIPQMTEQSTAASGQSITILSLLLALALHEPSVPYSS